MIDNNPIFYWPKFCINYQILENWWADFLWLSDDFQYKLHLVLVHCSCSDLSCTVRKLSGSDKSHCFNFRVQNSSIHQWGHFFKLDTVFDVLEFADALNSFCITGWISGLLGTLRPLRGSWHTADPKSLPLHNLPLRDLGCFVALCSKVLTLRGLPLRGFAKLLQRTFLNRLAWTAFWALHQHHLVLGAKRHVFTKDMQIQQLNLSVAETS